MKIALVSKEYPPETARGGIGSQTYMKAKGLSRLGHQVYVISRSDNKRYETLDGEICVIRIPGFEDLMDQMTEIVEWITHSIAVAAEIEALHKKVGLDLIDFPEWSAEGYVYLLNRTKWNGVPTVIQLHGPLVMFGHVMDWPERNSEFFRIGTQMEAICVQLADAVYSSSSCSADWITRYYDPQKNNVPVIHLGVNTKDFTPVLSNNKEVPTIIFVGKIVPNKGIQELVTAASHLVKSFPDLQLRIIGRGEENMIKRLKTIAEKARAENLLSFAGFVDKKDLPDEIRQASVFAAPSYYEGGPGFVYLEAMACGLPVIGCSGSGIDEIITNGVNGLLVPPQDAEKLEEALYTLLKDPGFANTIARNGYNYALKNADSEKCLIKLEEFYYATLKKDNINIAADA